ncbi:hypothetical protein C8R46DRAFT_1295285 [Mycena filopes]|nr:hypothetical protein C8R46DRAFT_1295285 [Mycena filopes]
MLFNAFILLACASALPSALGLTLDTPVNTDLVDVALGAEFDVLVNAWFKAFCNIGTSDKVETMSSCRRSSPTRRSRLGMLQQIYGSGREHPEDTKLMKALSVAMIMEIDEVVHPVPHSRAVWNSPAAGAPPPTLPAAAPASNVLFTHYEQQDDGTGMDLVVTRGEGVRISFRYPEAATIGR